MLKQISEPKYVFLFELGSLVTTDEPQSEPRGVGKYPARISSFVWATVADGECSAGLSLRKRYPFVT